MLHFEIYTMLFSFNGLLGRYIELTISLYYYYRYLFTNRTQNEIYEFWCFCVF